MIDRPDILIVEGLNVLQPAPHAEGRRTPIPFVSDFFDFSVYIDADEDGSAPLGTSNRFLTPALHGGSATRFPTYKPLTHELAEAGSGSRRPKRLWNRINLVNLRENIVPTRQRASLILEEGHRATASRRSPCAGCEWRKL